MLERRTIELWVGIFVALGIASLAMLSFRVANLGAVDISHGYNIQAHFDNIGGLKVKAPVTIAGVRVGRVADIRFDEDDYRAVVTLNIARQYDKLPDDTGAAILTAGLLGEQYIGLDPGGSPEYLKEGGQITVTQSALVLENLIGQFLYSKAAEEDTGGNKAK